MKLKDIAIDIENYQNYSQIADFENFLDVCYNKKSQKMNFNLNSTVYFNIDESQYLYTTVSADLHWTIISYNIYGTTRLAWLLMKLNAVNAENTFCLVRAGTKIRYLSKELVQDIIKSYY